MLGLNLSTKNTESTAYHKSSGISMVRYFDLIVFPKVAEMSGLSYCQNTNHHILTPRKRALQEIKRIAKEEKEIMLPKEEEQKFLK